MICRPENFARFLVLLLMERERQTTTLHRFYPAAVFGGDVRSWLNSPIVAWSTRSRHHVSLYPGC